MCRRVDPLPAPGSPAWPPQLDRPLSKALAVSCEFQYTRPRVYNEHFLLPDPFEKCAGSRTNPKLWWSWRFNWGVLWWSWCMQLSPSLWKDCLFARVGIDGDTCSEQTESAASLVSSALYEGSLLSMAASNIRTKWDTINYYAWSFEWSPNVTVLPQVIVQ